MGRHLETDGTVGRDVEITARLLEEAIAHAYAEWAETGTIEDTEGIRSERDATTRSDRGDVALKSTVRDIFERLKSVEISHQQVRDGPALTFNAPAPVQFSMGHINRGIPLYQPFYACQASTRCDCSYANW